jgi:L-cysteine S-thiosulfotransferase
MELEKPMRMERQVFSAMTFSGVVTAALLLAMGIAHAESSVAAGQKLAFDRSKGNCLTCHAIKGGNSPGNVGPPLMDMKSRYPDRKQLFAIIYDETKRNQTTVMPPFGRNLILTGQEINTLIDFLYTR